MSQHTGSHKNSLNLLGEKYLKSHWPMHRIRLLECRACFIELPSAFKMHSFIRKTSLFPFILVQVYIRCKTISSCWHFSQQQNRNWNSVHHCIKLDRKCRNLLYATQPYSAIFPRHIHHISIPNNAMKWSRMSEKWAKKHIFRVRQNARLNSLKKYTETTVQSAMTLHVVKYGTFFLWRQQIEMIITWSENDGWVRVLRPFNSISVLSGRWKGEAERLCAMKRR